MGVTIHLLIRFEAYSIHIWYSQPDQKPVPKESTREHTTVLLNKHTVKLPSKYLFVPID